MDFRQFLSGLGLLGLGAGLVANAAAAEDAVKLRHMPAIAKDVEAFPRIVAGAPPAIMDKINTALTGEESRLRAARKQCFHTSGGKSRGTGRENSRSRWPAPAS